MHIKCQRFDVKKTTPTQSLQSCFGIKNSHRVFLNLKKWSFESAIIIKHSKLVISISLSQQALSIVYAFSHDFLTQSKVKSYLMECLRRKLISI